MAIAIVLIAWVAWAIDLGVWGVAITNGNDKVIDITTKLVLVLTAAVIISLLVAAYVEYGTLLVQA